MERRKKGSGAIVRRGGRYYLRLTLPGGKRHEIMLKAKTLPTAREEAKEYQDDHEHALKARTKEELLLQIAQLRSMMDTGIPLKDAWKTFKASPGRPGSSPGTLANYERNWKAFISWLSGNFPDISRTDGITPEIADKYFQELWKGGISANTYNYHRQSIILVFKTVSGNMDPFTNIKRRDEIKAERNALTAQQLDKVLKAFGNPKLKLMNKDEMKLLFHLGAYTGGRLVDCATMRKASLDLAHGIMTFTPIKTQRTQRAVSIPIHAALKKELSGSMGGGSVYLLPRTAARYKRNPDGVIQDIIKVFEFCKFIPRKRITDKGQRTRKANLYGFHSFRHTFATIAANAGIPIATLAEILGDNIRTLEKYYVRIGTEAKRNAVNSLPG